MNTYTQTDTHATPIFTLLSCETEMFAHYANSQQLDTHICMDVSEDFKWFNKKMKNTKNSIKQKKNKKIKNSATLRFKG